MNLPRLVDRARQVQALRDLVVPGDRRLGILYGRRQVGKTFLLGRAWETPRVFYFLAADSSPEINRADLLRDLSAFVGRPFALADFPTWRTVFRLFTELAMEEPLVVVLDEFQYLLQGPDDAASQLVAVWDREARGRSLTLVLSGSEVSTIERLTGASQPLHGRADWVERLRPFDYLDAAAMTPGRPHRELAYLYGIFGGVPRYLAAIRASDSPSSAAVREMLAVTGSVHVQQSVLIEQERGIRQTAAFRAVLGAVASGRTTLNEISHAAGLGAEPRTVRRALEILTDLEVVEATRNIDAARTSPHFYRVADNAVNFWHRFVVPHRSHLAVGAADVLWSEVVAPRLDDYMGLIFERMVLQALRRAGSALVGSAPLRIARWQGSDRHRRPIEIDLVAELADESMLVGEVKWSRQRRGLDLLHDLRRDVDDLAASGREWARRARDGHFLLVSAGGFDRQVHERAAADARLHLLDLAGLYAIA